jgi:hypothetical protein
MYMGSALVIVVNWAEIGRSMKDRKFRVQSSLFRSLWLVVGGVFTLCLKNCFIVKIETGSRPLFSSPLPNSSLVP